jgi:hypothetical protein
MFGGKIGVINTGKGTLGEISKATITNSIFENNECIYGESIGFVDVKGNVSLSNSTFKGSLSRKDGGVLYVMRCKRLAIDSWTVLDAKAEGRGGVFSFNLVSYDQLTRRRRSHIC